MAAGLTKLDEDGNPVPLEAEMLSSNKDIATQVLDGLHEIANNAVKMAEGINELDQMDEEDADPDKMEELNEGSQMAQTILDGIFDVANAANGLQH